MLKYECSRRVIFMPLEHPPEQPTPTPFDVAKKKDGEKHAPLPFGRNLPPGTLVGLAITVGALAIILLSAIVYRLTPQPKSPYLVGNAPHRATTARTPPQIPADQVVVPAQPAVEEPAIPIVANESAEAAAE